MKYCSNVAQSAKKCFRVLKMQNSAPNSKKCSKGAQRNRERPNCQPMFGKMSPHSSSLRVGSKTWPGRRGKSSLRKPYSSKTFSWKNTHYIHCDPQIQTAVFSVYFVKNSSRAPGGGGSLPMMANTGGLRPKRGRDFRTMITREITAWFVLFIVISLSEAQFSSGHD